MCNITAFTVQYRDITGVNYWVFLGAFLQLIVVVHSWKHTHWNTFNEWMPFWSLVCSLWETAVDAQCFAFTLVCSENVCAWPPLQALCYDSGMYATTCDGSCLLRGQSARGETRRAELVHQERLGSISLYLPRWLLLCPTYCCQPTSQPSSPSLLLFGLSLCLQGTLCCQGGLFCSSIDALTYWSLD